MFFAIARSRLAGIVLALASVAALSAGARIQAAEKLNNSLDFVPADASFYAASLRMKEQLDLVLASKAWARLMEMPSVKAAIEMAKTQIEQPGGAKEQWERFSENPDNLRLLEVLREMASTEAFVYGDKNFAPALSLAMEAAHAAQFGPLFNKLAGGAASDEQAAMTALLTTLNANLDRLVVPGLVLGFKISDTAKADLQIRRLETLVNVVIQLLTINEFKDRFGRVNVDGTDFIELRLDGRLVPWEELPFDKYAENPGDYEKLKQRLRSLKLTIDLGIKDGYVLLSIANGHEHLVNFGKGELLVSRSEMKPLQPHLGKRLVGVSYASQLMNALVQPSAQDVDRLVDVANQLLPHLDLPADVEKRVLDDVEALSKDIKPFLTKAGASMSFSYLTPSGYESFGYDWTVHPTLDTSKPLTLLEHAGGSPLFVAVQRHQHRPQDYALFVKWVTKAYGYFEELALPHMPDDERQKFEFVSNLAIPLIKRIDAATRNDLIPALAEGQSGLVVDADITSLRWHSELPSLGKPLPMLEIAIVVGVSDLERLKKAFAEYKAVAQVAIDKVRELNPQAIPAGYTIPEPSRRQASGGEILWYVIPPQSGLDPQVQPAVGVSKSLAVASTSIQQVERILAETPLKAPGDVIDAQQPASSAFVFNFPALVDTLRPWVELGVALRASEAESDSKQPDVSAILTQVQTGAEILKCYRGTASMTYNQNGATVTHRQSIFEDLE
jgi:hypothetical protein